MRSCWRCSLDSKPARFKDSAFSVPSRLPFVMILLALVLTAVSAFGVTRLRADTRADLLADPSSASYQDQALFADTFGGDPVVIMAQPSAGADLISPDHMLGLRRLEADLGAVTGVKKVYGPGSLVNTLAVASTTILLSECDQEGKAAAAAALARRGVAAKPQEQQDQIALQAYLDSVKVCAQRYAKAFPSLGIPAVNDPTFLRGILLEPDGQHIRPFWNWAMPDATHAIITVRMKRDATLDQVRQVLTLVRQAPSRAELKDIRFTASGAPALTSSLADAVFASLRLLLPLALLAMLVVAVLALRTPAIVAVLLAGLATLWTGGLAGLLGLPVTPATLAVLPIVIGLTADYFIQSVNRVTEETGDIRHRVGAAARRILPSTGLAALATAAGMLAFAIPPTSMVKQVAPFLASSIPLVRQFAAFMALGVAMAYLANLLVGLPGLLLLGRLRPRALVRSRLHGPAAGRLARAAVFPMAAILLLAAVGLAGWAGLPALKVETDPAQLMPASDPALLAAQSIRKEVGIAGEMDLVLKAEDAGADTTSQVPAQWLRDQTTQAVTASSGDLKRLQSLPDFLSGFNRGVLPDAARTSLILQRIPAYFSDAVVSRDHTLALSIFGLRNVTSVERDGALVQQLRSLSPPPPGFRAYPAGLAVVASDALDALRSEQVELTLLALLLIAIVLAVAYRSLTFTALALIPTVVAAGAAIGLLAFTTVALGVRSSPITVLLGGVVVAFATEFSVLWLSRFRSELAGGSTPEQAAATASGRVGPAILASALALIATFAVLAVSPVPTVRDFGIWSASDLALATGAVLLLLPSLARAWLGRPRPVLAPEAPLAQPEPVPGVK